MTLLKRGLYVVCLAVLLAGCGEREPAAVVEEAVVEAPVEIPKYSAEAFFETTAYSMVGSSGLAFSPDGKTLLIASDESGVFNATYTLPIDGGEPEQADGFDR